MPLYIFNILFILIIINNWNAADAQLKGKLIFTHIVFRHGDRTPIETYPKDPWNNEKFWSTGWGQLTNIGKMQHYLLGKWFRNRYRVLTNLTYSSDSIYVQSTDVDRTLTSALSNLAGFYEPQREEMWNMDIDWQPIPVHTIPENQDYILAAKKSCPSYKSELKKLLQSDEFKALDKRFSYLYDYLTKNTGYPVTSLEDVQRIHDILFIESTSNKTLPEWTKSVYPGGDMEYIAKLSFATSTYTTKLARLKVGPLLKEILDRFQMKTDGKLSPNRSIWIYSGHDLTIANLLNSLKLFEYHCPPYTATILMELRLYNNKPLVSVYYKNSSEEPVPLVIPNCGIQCSLKDMYKLYNDVIPEDWESECKLSTPIIIYQKNIIDINIEILIIVTGIILIAIIIYIIISYKKAWQLYAKINEFNNSV